MNLVIDQNRLRSKPHEPFAPLEMHLKAAPENMAVLTDTAVFEMLKGNAPAYVASKSLEILSRFPDQVLATDGTGVLMRKELGEGKAISSLVSDDLTKRLNTLLRKARLYYDGKEKNFPIDEAVVARESADIKRQRLDHDQHKIMLDDGIKALKLAPPELQTKLRKGVFDKEVYSFLYQTAFVGFRDAIAHLNINPEVVQKLYLDYCLTARISMVGLLFAVQWFRSGGADSLKKEAATNQFIDNDYVASASYFDGILSEEGRVNELYEMLRNLLEANYAT